MWIEGGVAGAGNLDGDNKKLSQREISKMMSHLTESKDDLIKQLRELKESKELFEKSLKKIQSSLFKSFFHFLRVKNPI